MTFRTDCNMGNRFLKEVTPLAQKRLPPVNRKLVRGVSASLVRETEDILQSAAATRDYASELRKQSQRLRAESKRLREQSSVLCVKVEVRALIDER